MPKNEVWMLKDAMKGRENGTQKALYLLADECLMLHKKVQLLSEEVEKLKMQNHPGTKIERARKKRKLRTDGTPKEFKPTGEMCNGEPVYDWI